MDFKVRVSYVPEFSLFEVTRVSWKEFPLKDVKRFRWSQIFVWECTRVCVWEKLSVNRSVRFAVVNNRKRSKRFFGVSLEFQWSQKRRTACILKGCVSF